MFKSVIYSIIIAGFILDLSSCASIIHGPKQFIDFSSRPTGAAIFIDGQYVGKTPRVISLRRKGSEKGQAGGKKEYAVKLEVEGYSSFETTIRRKVDGWFFGNILFGGVIGIVIDAANGSMYKLNPSIVTEQLSKMTTVSKNNDGTIYMVVTLDPDPSWEKIGQLQKR